MTPNFQPPKLDIPHFFRKVISESPPHEPTRPTMEKLFIKNPRTRLIVWGPIGLILTTLTLMVLQEILLYIPATAGDPWMKSGSQWFAVPAILLAYTLISLAVLSVTLASLDRSLQPLHENGLMRGMVIGGIVFLVFLVVFGIGGLVEDSLVDSLNFGAFYGFVCGNIRVFLLGLTWESIYGRRLAS